MDSKCQLEKIQPRFVKEQRNKGLLQRNFDQSILISRFDLPSLSYRRIHMYLLAFHVLCSTSSMGLLIVVRFSCRSLEPTSFSNHPYKSRTKIVTTFFQLMIYILIT